MNLHITAALALTFLLTGMGFGIKEYDAFHDVLHPLEHEALPKGDFAKIRSQAKELIARGDAIVKLGVPGEIKAERAEEFKKHLDGFAKALVEFGTHAESGTDADLKTSYSAVHDLFEELAHMLPRKA
jgi:hypothetical protein